MKVQQIEDEQRESGELVYSENSIDEADFAEGKPKRAMSTELKMIELLDVSRDVFVLAYHTP